MGQYDGLIADARVALTECAMTMNGARHDIPLRLRTYADRLEADIRLLSEASDGRKSLFGRLREAMFDTAEDVRIAQAAARVADDTYQLRNCTVCKCANCVHMSDACRCAGCVLGARVADCDYVTTETRSADADVLRLDDMPIERLTYDRRTGRTRVTVRTAGDTERTWGLHLETGEKYPI